LGLSDIYYYFIAFAMMAGVIIAYLLNLDIWKWRAGDVKYYLADILKTKGFEYNPKRFQEKLCKKVL